MRDVNALQTSLYRHDAFDRNCPDRGRTIQKIDRPVISIEALGTMKQRYVADPDFTFDILRGLARYTGSRLISALAEAVIRHPFHNISQALGHRQVRSKTWLRDQLYLTLGGAFGKIWIVGGWYGVLAAILFDDPRFMIGEIVSIDADPDCAPVARTLNNGSATGGRFEAVTSDMHALDYDGADRPDLVVNTSCEHIPDLAAWLALIPAGMLLVLQSNDYFSEPEHINCVKTLEAFERQAGLAEVLYRGEYDTGKYTRFMLIGRR